MLCAAAQCAPTRPGAHLEATALAFAPESLASPALTQALIHSESRLTGPFIIEGHLRDTGQLF